MFLAPEPSFIHDPSPNRLMALLRAPEQLKSLKALLRVVGFKGRQDLFHVFFSGCFFTRNSISRSSSFISLNN